MSKKRENGKSSAEEQKPQTDSDSDCKYRQLPKVIKSQNWQLLQPPLQDNGLQPVTTKQVGLYFIQEIRLLIN